MATSQLILDTDIIIDHLRRHTDAVKIALRHIMRLQSQPSTTTNCYQYHFYRKTN